MKLKLAAVCTAAAVLSGCATPEVVQQATLQDSSMTCQQIANDAARVAQIREEAAAGKGVTGTNVAAAVLFWPAIIGNVMNANQAMEAADARQAELIKLAEAKNCNIQ